MSKRHAVSRESSKLIWMCAEEDVVNCCFYCRKCAKCSKFYESMTECMAKGLLSFIKEVMNLKVVRRGKNKHFKIKPKD